MEKLQTITKTEKIRIGILTRPLVERTGQDHYRGYQETFVFVGLTEKQFLAEKKELSRGKRKPYDLLFWNGQKGKIIELLQEKYLSDAEKNLIIAVRDHFPDLFNTCVDAVYKVG